MATQTRDPEKRFELIFLDLDDTLMDFHKAEELAMVETFREFGLRLEDGLRAAYEAINRELWAALERGEIDIGFLKHERFRRLFAGAYSHVDPEAFSARFVHWLGKGSYPLPGAIKLCTALAARYRLLILSNGIKDVQDPRIANSALAGLVETVVVSEEAGFGKPDPRIFEYACNRINYHDKAGILMIGDSLASDIRGGANFGIASCWYNPEHKANGTGLRPDYEVDSLEAIGDILLR